MAKVLDPLHSVRASGTEDGLVFYKYRLENISRQWLSPANTITSRRTAVRAIITSVSALWAELSTSQIQAWNFYATSIRNRISYYGHRKLSGYEIFMEYNFFVVDKGMTAILDPPWKDTPTRVKDVSDSAPPSGTTGFQPLFNLLSTPLGNGFLDMWVTPQSLSPNLSPCKSNYVHWNYAYYYDGLPPWTGGDIGAYIYWKVRYISENGIPTPFVKFVSIIQDNL